MASPEKSLRGKKKGSSSKKKKASPKKRIKRTVVDHGEDGSHVISHQFDQGDGTEPTTPDLMHGVSDSSGLLAHMQDQFGGQLPGAAAAGPGAAAAPPAAAQAGM